MRIEAWLVVGEPHHREVTIDHATAVEHAAKRHGLVKSLVLADDVEALCREAFDRGVRHGQQQRHSHE
jgi:hypothetical protein